MAAFLDMGGHAAFIWPAYALTLAVLVAVGVGSWRSLRAAEQELAELEDGRDPRP